MIYISTGFFKNLNFNQVLNLYKKNRINNIEFSGGKYQENLLNSLKKEKKINALFHNYFPVPKKPIIINLSSNNKFVIDSSIKLIKKAIDYSSAIKSQFYSIHAGYLIEMNFDDFGKVKTKKKIINRDTGMANFIKNISSIARYAKKKSRNFNRK